MRRIANVPLPLILFIVIILIATVIIVPRIFLGNQNTSSINFEDISQVIKNGDVLFDQGNYTQAIEYYDKALGIDPNNVEALFNKGISLDNLGKFEGAITYYDKVLAIDPNHVNTLFNKGVALDNLGKYQEAITYYDKVLAINSTDSLALNNKGVALDNLGKYQEAITYYDKVLAINSTDSLALNNKGVDLLNLGVNDEAINYFDKVLAINSTDTDALLNKGVVLYDIGKYDEAINYFDNVLAINSTNNLALSNKALVLVDKGNSTEALSLISMANKSNPSSELPLEARAYISYIGKKYTDAAKFYKKALDINPNMRSILTHRELTALDGLITILQSSTNNNTFNHYFSENNGISMEYPSSWAREQNMTDPNLVSFFPSTSPKSAVVTVNKYKLQNISNEDSQQIFDMYSLALMKNINNNFNISSIKTSKISNATAYEVDFHNGKNVTILWTYKDSYIYSIMYVSDSINYGKYLPVFKDMINSLTIMTISKSNFANFYTSLLERYLDIQKQ